MSVDGPGSDPTAAGTGGGEEGVAALLKHKLAGHGHGLRKSSSADALAGTAPDALSVMAWGGQATPSADQPAQGDEVPAEDGEEAAEGGAPGSGDEVGSKWGRKARLSNHAVKRARPSLLAPEMAAIVEGHPASPATPAPVLKTIQSLTSPYKRMSMCLMSAGSPTPGHRRRSTLRAPRIVAMEDEAPIQQLDHNKVIRALHTRKSRRSCRNPSVSVAVSEVSFPKTIDEGDDAEAASPEGGPRDQARPRKSLLALFSEEEGEAMLGSTLRMANDDDEATTVAEPPQQHQSSNAPAATPSAPTAAESGPAATPAPAQAEAGEALPKPKELQELPKTAPAGSKDHDRAAPLLSRGSTFVFAEDGTDELIFEYSNGIQMVMAGSPIALLEFLLGETPLPENRGWRLSRLLQGNSDEDQFLSTFLLSFRTFLPEPTLLDVLAQQVSEKDPNDPAVARALEVVKEWVVSCWPDFRDEKNYDALMYFLDACTTSTSIANEAAVISNCIDKNRQADRVRMSLTKTAAPQVALICVTAEHLARQLTLYNSRLFQKVHPVDLIQLALQSKTSPALHALITRFDREFYWVEYEMSSNGDSTVQAALLERFIEVAYYCKQLCNFFSLFTVLGALDTPVIRKLKGAWAKVSKESKKTLKKLVALTSVEKNMKAYRTAFKKVASKSKLPFLPIAMKDLRFIADGNSQKIDGLINFDRLRVVATYAKQMHKGFSNAYKKLSPDSKLQIYFAKAEKQKFQSEDSRRRETHKAQVFQDDLTSMREELLFQETYIGELEQELRNLKFQNQDMKQDHALEISLKDDKIMMLEAQLRLLHHTVSTRSSMSSSIVSPGGDKSPGSPLATASSPLHTADTQAVDSKTGSSEAQNGTPAAANPRVSMSRASKSPRRRSSKVGPNDVLGIPAPTTMGAAKKKRGTPPPTAPKPRRPSATSVTSTSATKRRRSSSSASLKKQAASLAGATSQRASVASLKEQFEEPAADNGKPRLKRPLSFVAAMVHPEPDGTAV